MAIHRTADCWTARVAAPASLAGNFWEWCGDLYDPADIKDPNGARVLRGGSWGNYQDDARSAYRNRNDPYVRYYDVGFRVVCSSPSSGH
jgi:formylglycine-generating enzyme required for sulfatase activity